MIHTRVEIALVDGQVQISTKEGELGEPTIICDMPLCDWGGEGATDASTSLGNIILRALSNGNKDVFKSSNIPVPSNNPFTTTNIAQFLIRRSMAMKSRSFISVIETLLLTATEDAEKAKEFYDGHWPMFKGILNKYPE